jgi:hypothetical protein
LVPEKVPPLHDSHALDPLAPEKAPALHREHWDAPETLETDPAGQVRHPLEPLCPM